VNAEGLPPTSRRQSEATQTTAFDQVGRGRVRRVGVVIITHNSSAVLPGCLESLRLDQSAGVDVTDVVVVDNASHDASRAIAEATAGLPISVLQKGENVGYAAGFNAGVRRLATRPPDAVLLLNPDCRLRPGTLAALCRAVAQVDHGIVAPRLLNPDGSLQPTLRRFPTVSGAFAEAVLGGRLSDRLGLGELIFATEPHQRPGRASWVTGAALLMKWDLLVDVGPWDERFLLYSEETEFMLRARDRGWTTWYEPTAVVEHLGGDSDSRPCLAALLTVNKVALFRRRHGAARSAAYGACVLLGMFLRAAAGASTARAAAVALILPSRRIRSLAELK
jgi:GT2 family glycosyltransferase